MKLNSKCVDESEVYVRLKESPVFVADWAVDNKLFKRLKVLEASLKCQVMRGNEGVRCMGIDAEQNR